LAARFAGHAFVIPKKAKELAEKLVDILAELIQRKYVNLIKASLEEQRRGVTRALHMVWNERISLK
jgi:hypothetical protein